MTATDDLKPCPFCGGMPQLLPCAGKETGMWRVWHECDFVTTSYFESKAEAIEAWNTRAAVTDADFSVAVQDGKLWRRIKDHVRCRYCGLNIESVIPLDGCNRHAIRFCPNCGKAVK